MPPSASAFSGSMPAAAHGAASIVVEGLKLFVPPGTSAVLRQRIAHLNRDLAKWELYELDERTQQLTAFDTTDAGNIATRLVHAPDKHSALERFASSIAQVLALFPTPNPSSSPPLNSPSACTAYSLPARASAPARDSFRPAEQLYFGVRAAEFPVDDSNQDSFPRLPPPYRDAPQLP